MTSADPFAKSSILDRIAGKLPSLAVKSLTSSRRKFAPILNVCFPRSIERSSTSCHWVTLRPWGNNAKNGSDPDPEPSGVRLVSVVLRMKGNVESALPRFGLWNSAE